MSDKAAAAGKARVLVHGKELADGIDTSLANAPREHLMFETACTADVASSPVAATGAVMSVKAAAAAKARLLAQMQALFENVDNVLADDPPQQWQLMFDTVNGCLA